MPAAYVIAEIEITHPEGYKEYTAQVPATIQKYGGRFLVRGGRTQVLEGGAQVVGLAGIPEAQGAAQGQQQRPPAADRRARVLGVRAEPRSQPVLVAPGEDARAREAHAPREERG